MKIKALITISIALLTVGCVQKEGPAQTVPKIHVVAEKQGPEVKIDAYDADILFDRAAAKLRLGDCTEAAKEYEKLINEFPESSLVEPSLYNQGLCLDELHRYDEAAGAYVKLLEKFPDSKDTKDAYFRLTGSYENLEKWSSVLSTLERLEEAHPQLSAVDKIEVLVRKGAALLETEQSAQAKYALESAIRIYKHDDDISQTSPDFYYSMAQFKLAEILHSQMRGINLPPDDKQLAKILEKKCQLLLDSQYLYTKVIKIGHPHWSGAAAYRTGALYHHLWVDMLNAKTPEGLTVEEREVYTEILRKRIKILLRKAVTQWRRTLKFAARLKLKSDWVAQTQSDLTHIEELLKTEERIAQDLHIEH